MSFKSKLSYLIISFLLLTLVFLGVLTILFFYLPGYLESEYLPKIAKQAGLSDFACQVRRIDFSGAELGALRIGNGENPPISIESLRVEYSPRGLYKKHIKRVVVSGVEIHCQYQNGALAIPGFDFEKLNAHADSDKKTTAPATDILPSIPIGSFKIRRSRVILEWQGQRFRFPLDLEVNPQNQDWHALDCILSISPRDQKIVLSANIDLNQKKALLEFDAAAIHLERFSDMVKILPGLNVYGEMDIRGKADLQIMPFRVSDVLASCDLRNAEIAYHNLSIASSRNQKNEKLPLLVQITGNESDGWTINGSSIALRSPIPLTVSDIQTVLKIDRETLESSGDLTVALDTLYGVEKLPLEILEPVRLNTNFFTKLSKNGEWNFTMGSAGRKQAPLNTKGLRFKLNDYEIVSRAPQFEISAKGSKGQGAASGSLKLPRVQVKAASTNIQMPSIALYGDVAFNPSIPAAPDRLNVKLKAMQAKLAVNSTLVDMPAFSMTGALRHRSGKAMRFGGVAKISNAAVSDSKLNVRGRDIDASLPLHWPVAGLGKKGNFSVNDLQWKKLNLGSVSGALQQSGLGLLFDGTHFSKLLRGLKLNFRGKSAISSSNRLDARVDFDILPYRSPADIDLGRFIPSAKGAVFNAKLNLKGGLVSDNSGLTGSLDLKLQDGHVRLKEKKIAIEGIQLSLLVPDLPQIRSAPNQLLRFKTAYLGEINVSDGKIEYQIESPRSFFIERSSFRWCDGNVDTQAMRISPGIEDYHLILYCDRLKLAMILEQFGVAGAEGQGAVNGKIPLRFKNGKLSFDDGFLFSTPGDGGTIHLSGTEVLTAGLQPGTPQYAQIELAREALKGYDYKWAKLNLTTEGEDLLLRMQFDGKPSKPLPFVYKKNIGSFVKVEAGSKGSIFQGIHLDVNFRLPLDKILRYKDILKMIR
jgi:hypothetical protein